MRYLRRFWGLIVLVAAITGGCIFTTSENDDSLSVRNAADPLFSMIHQAFPFHQKPGGASFTATSPTRIDTTDTTRWTPPRFSERREERHRMVREQIGNRGINDQAVIKAMQHVPRHEFVPQSRKHNAYEDRPLPIGHDQTISQPYIVAFMTQALDLDSTDKVLEIGTGSGYQAALLSEITPRVYTIEIVEPLARKARERFKQLGYSTIRVKIGDGYQGWPAYAPFDAIIVTAAPDHIPSPLIQQLKPGGIMVIPVGSTYSVQKLKKIRKTAEGDIETQTLLPVRFVPMTGEAEEQ